MKSATAWSKADLFFLLDALKHGVAGADVARFLGRSLDTSLRLNWTRADRPLQSVASMPGSPSPGGSVAGRDPFDFSSWRKRDIVVVANRTGVEWAVTKTTTVSLSAAVMTTIIRRRSVRELFAFGSSTSTLANYMPQGGHPPHHSISRSSCVFT